MKGERPKLTLEDYVAFFNNKHGRSGLTIAQLNQIVLMHGFVKLHRCQKAHILMALRSLELMRPDRSTLRHLPPVTGAALSLEDVKRDIESLGWQECPVASVLSVGETAAMEAVPISSSPDLSRSTPATDHQKKATGNAEGKRKRISIDASLSSFIDG
ncbi:uncharacterized protein [Elaeis guineensis]|uniref:uncharacterized protein n=1 Tax=Elaeis guineensis var. tenera TaxID=51953 RepID=UPI00057A2615